MSKLTSIRSFTDLQAWREGHALVLEIYKVTKTFPLEEQFGLTSQLRRAAVSVTSNIAEGFSKRTSKEKIQFYTTSLASLSEIQNQILISRDIAYIDGARFKDIAEKTVCVQKMIHGLIRYLRVGHRHS